MITEGKKTAICGRRENECVEGAQRKSPPQKYYNYRQANKSIRNYKTRDITKL